MMENVLHITVKKAKTEFENPAKVKTFLILQVDGKIVKTPIVIGSNPVWHQRCSFDVCGANKQLEVRLMKDGFIFQDLCGFIILPLADVHFSDKEGPGKWLPFCIEKDNEIVTTKHELLIDMRYELPSGLTAAETQELSKKLRVLNEVLAKEVQTISEQHKRISNIATVNNRQSSVSFASNETTPSIEEQHAVQILEGSNEIIPIDEQTASCDDQEIEEAGQKETFYTSSDSHFCASIGDDETFYPADYPNEISEEDRLQILEQFKKFSTAEKQPSAHNSDSEADKDMKQYAQHSKPDQHTKRRMQSRITAKRNWHKALDDIKEARKSGVYSSVSNENEEYTARERVKSILQEPVKVKERPKSAGDVLSMYSAEEEEDDDQSKHNSEEHLPQEEVSSTTSYTPDNTLAHGKFQRRFGFRHSPRNSKRRQS